MDQINECFGVVNDDGNIDVMLMDSGEFATRLDANVYPVGSSLSARYEHAEGIALTLDDAKRIELEIAG